MNQRRAWQLALIIGAGMTLSSCGGDPSDLVQTGADAPSVSDAERSLPGFLAADKTEVVASEPTLVDGQILAVIASQTPPPMTAPREVVPPGESTGPTREPPQLRRTISIAEYDDGAWKVEETVTLPKDPPAFDFDATAAVEVGDVTNDGDADFLVPLLAQGPIAVLVTGQGGQWHLATFRYPSGVSDVYLGLEPSIQDEHLVALGGDGPRRRPVVWEFDGKEFCPSSSSTK